VPHEFETGFFVGRPAWHGLGRLLPEAPSIGDALRLAGLDWEVQERQLYACRDDEFRTVETGHKAIVRATDGRVLGVVGKRYTPVQNRKALEPFQPLVQAGLVELDAAGSLRDGQRVWILGKLKGAEAQVVPGDAVRGYMLFYNGHDGTLAASYQKTAIRVVCMNTLSMAVARGEEGSEGRIQFRHTANVVEQVDALTRQFSVAAEHFADTVGVYRHLAAGQCPDPKRYFRKVLGLKNGSGANGSGNGHAGRYGALDVAEEGSAREQGKRQLARLLELFETQPGAGYGAGSYWQAYNAVTFWVDHDRGRSNDARMNASWFGSGRIIRDRALEVALEDLKN
jgi:phage/plasmid-like protein (TIGR03299 family)